MAEENYQCFICCNVVAATGEIYNDNNFINVSVLTNGSSLLSKNVDVIFVLRKVLQVPSIHLENQLKECGSDPESWIRLCDQCSQLTKNARELDLKIRKIEKQLRCVRKQVVETMISSGVSQEGYHDVKHIAYLDQNSLSFSEKIRSYVTYDYTYNFIGKDDDGPADFLEGDKLANYLVSQQNSSTAKVLVVEKPMDNVANVQIKLEVEAPKSPMSPVPLMSSLDDGAVTPRSSEASASSDDEEYSEKKRKTRPKSKYKRKPRKIEICHCPHCGKQCKTKSQLQCHVRNVHLKTFTILCSICDKGFPGNQAKYRHMLAIHKDDPVTLKLQKEKGLIFKRCSVVGCGVIFLKEGQEEKHKMDIHNPNAAPLKFNCKYCGDEFKFRSSRRDHERKHEKKGITGRLRPVKEKWKPSGDRRSKMGADGKIQCGECGNMYLNGLVWSTHFWNKHGQVENVRCPVEECGMNFKVCGGDEDDTLKEFRGHWKERHLQRKKCDICEKPSYQCSHYIIKKLGVEGGPRICSMCGEEKATYHMLIYHMNRVHKVNMKGEPLNKDEKMVKAMKKVLCNLCGKEYADKKSLGTHVKLVHEKKFDLSCHVCGAAMQHRRQLSIHLLGMHKEDPVTKELEEKEGLSLIKCEVKGCGARFLRKEELDKHVEGAHKGGLEKEAKKFPCKICGKVFYMRAKLVYHEKVHEKDRNNGKPVKCETCGKGFDTGHYLRCHQRAVHKY